MSTVLPSPPPLTAPLSLCQSYVRRRDGGRWVNEKGTEDKTSSPKNYVSSRWLVCRSRIYVEPGRRTRTRCEKIANFFFIIIILLYSLARASIPMPNNNEKPHTSSRTQFVHSEFRTRAFEPQQRKKKKHLIEPAELLFRPHNVFSKKPKKKVYCF